MQFESSQRNVLGQLAALIEQISGEQYSKPCKTLSDASVGQHVRHIIELYICLFTGYHSGYVNYDARKRDSRIESDKNFAAGLIEMITNHFNQPDKALLLQISDQETANCSFSINTNYYRELMYNMEHTVHHMALIRIGIKEISAIALPETFGVAAATIKYRKSCAQ